MGRCAIQIVMGPAGSGKSTYCHSMQEHGSIGATTRRRVFVANLDPAAEIFLYDAAFDVRDLINTTEVMQELGLGPNGALLYSMEYLLENLDWLQTELEDFNDDDYLLLDCPGQLELYTHVPIMKRILERMKTWGYDESSTVTVFCVDAAFLTDADKFLSGQLLSLSAMIALELPHVNVLTKCDLMSAEEVDRILDQGSAKQLWDVEQDKRSLLLTQQAPLNYYQEIVPPSAAGQKGQGRRSRGNSVASDADADDAGSATSSQQQQQHEQLDYLTMLERRRRKRHALTDAISSLLDDYSMVSFVPLNIRDEESLDHVMAVVDHAIQYGENLEVKGCAGDDDDENNDNNDYDDGGGGGGNDDYENAASYLGGHDEGGFDNGGY